MKHRFTGYLAFPFILAVCAATVLADETFYRMFRAENYADAVKYADDRLPPSNRDAQLWASIGIAHENLDAPEKALACYLVGMKMDDRNYDTYLGAARVYNKLKQPDNAADMAKKAMDIKMTGDASWEYARALIGQGKGGEAKKALEKVVETDASNVVANRELGGIYYNEKDYAKALPLMKRSLAKQPDGELALKVALAHKELGQTDSAIVYFNKAASDKSSPKPQVLVELARLYYESRNYKDAAIHFEKAQRSALTADDLYAWAVSLENNKADDKSVTDAYDAALKKFGSATSASALIAREKVGRALIARKSFREADGVLTPLVRADPGAKNVPDIYLLMAQVNEGLGNNNSTITYLEKAIELDKKNVEAYARLGDLYAKTGQESKAKATYERLVSLDPNSPQIHMALGDYNMKSQKYSEALKSYQRAFTLNGSAEAAVGMMNAAWNLKRYDLARDAAESALHRDPAMKAPQLMLAKVYMIEENYRAARSILLPLLKTETNNLDLWKDLAEVSEKTGDASALADADKRIIALDPKNVPSRMRVAKAAEKSGDLRTAYDILKELAVLRPKDADIHKSLYDIAIKQKNNTAAANHLRDLLALRPNDAVGHRELGNLQFTTGDSKGALASYRTAVKADPRITGMYKNYANILLKDKAPAAELMPVLVAAVEANEADEGIFTAAGQEYQKQSNFSKAADMYQRALAVNSKNMANLAALAFCQEKAGKTGDAILSYEQVTAMNPNATKEFKALGDLYAKQNKMPQAVAAYKKYLDKTPTDVKTARVVGDHEYSQKKWEEANKYYAMVSGDDAKRGDYLLNFGTSCYEAKNYVRAGMLFKQLADANPRDPAPLRKLYEIETLNKNASASAEILQKYVALVPGDAAMQKALGDMLYDTRNQTGALAAYGAALKADPSTRGIHKRYVELLLKSGAAAEQIAALNAAIAANEADAAMYAKLGDLYKAANNCKAAVPVLEKASQMDSKNTAVLASIADCHVKSGNAAAAVLSLEQVTMMNPGATAEFKLLGDLYVKQNKTGDAVKAYRKFLEKGTDNAAARLVGEEAFKAKQWADAVRYLGMVKGMEKSISFLEMFGRAAFENKDNLKAVETYKQLAVLNPQNAEYVRMQYDLANRMGARDESVAQMKKYLSLKPDDAAMQKLLGDQLYDRKEMPGALAAYKAALAADPKAKGFHKRYVELVDKSGTAAEKVAAMEGAIAADEADAAMLIKLGNIYRDQKQPGKAVPLFQNALKDRENSRNLQLLLALAQSQEAAGMLGEAIVTYEQYLVQDPKATNEYKVLGDLYAKQKKPADALRSYRRYLERNPRDNAVALQVAKEAFNAKQWSEAVKYFAMVQGDETKKPEFLKLYGTAAYEGKDNPRAMTVLKDLAVLTPKDADVLKMLEEVCRRTGSTELAITYLRQYAALRPQDAEANMRLGDLLYDRKDEAGALAAYRAAIKNDPNLNVKGFQKKYAGLVMKSGTDAEKMAALTAAISNGEGDVNMYATLGKLHKDKSEFAKAAEMYEQASKLDGRNSTYLAELADCQIKAGNTNAAIQTLMQASMLNPKEASVHRMMGDLYMKQNKSDQAIDSYRKFLDLTPGDSKIAQLVGDQLFEKKQFDQAYKYLSMVRDNTSPAFYYRLGVSAQEAKNSTAAIDALERFRTAARAAPPKTPVPNRPEALKMLALAYENAKNNRKASEVINEYLQLPGVKDPEAAYKRALLIEAESPEQAIRAFEENTSAYPRDYRNFLKAGIYYARKGGNTAKAAQMFEKCVQLADTISRAWFELGLFYGGQNKNKDMMRAFEKFITIETRNADAILRVGEYLLVSKNMAAEAMMFLEMANALKPNDPKVMALLARGYMKTGRTDESVKQLEQVVRSTRGAPVDIEIRITLGDAYLSLGRNMEAASEWKQVTDQKREPQYLIKYATALLAINNTSQAVGISNEILAKQPENIEAVMLSGRIKMAQRNYEEAMETFKKVGYINPNYAPALYERAQIFLIQQNYDWAKTFYERALKLDAKYALAELGMAKVAKAQKNDAEYRKRLDRARSLDPGNKDIQDELKRAGGR